MGGKREQYDKNKGKHRTTFKISADVTSARLSIV